MYNTPGEKTAIFCSKHKKDGMVDIIHKKCQHEGCTTRPTFNKPGEKIAIFCSKHKKDGMVNVMNKTCQHEGCTTQPAFNMVKKPNIWLRKNKTYMKVVLNQVKKLVYFVVNILM